MAWSIGLTASLGVALGGALGALCRFWVYNALPARAAGFPWPTLVVNVLGSCLLGVLFVLVMEKAQLGPQWQRVWGTGFLGAFTTFSTFSLEALLLQRGQAGLALVFIVGMVLLCLLAAWLGLSLGRAVF